MNATPIAVIILNYFGHAETLSCMQSIAPQSDFHVFIVDNSGDAIEGKKLRSAFGQTDRIRIIEPGVNLGFAKGVNLGLRTAASLGYTRFLILNNDTVVSANAAAVFSAAFERHPQSLIAPAIEEAGGINRGNYYHPGLGLILTGCVRNPGRQWFFYLSGCAIALSSAALERMGFLDEDFFMYGEDVEYSCRAARLRLGLITLNEALVTHAGSRSSKRASLFYEYHVNRAHMLLCFKLCNSKPSGWLSLVLKTPVLWIRCVYRAISNRSTAPVIGLLLAPFRLSIRPRCCT